jgi:pyruvate dehydrogenase E1 component
VREYFFNTPELKALWPIGPTRKSEFEPRRPRPPQDLCGVHAVNHKGQPTVILPKTIKGYGMEDGGAEHHASAENVERVAPAFRDRYKIPVPDDKLEKFPSSISPNRSSNMRRGGWNSVVPPRAPQAAPLIVPELGISSGFPEEHG